MTLLVYVYPDNSSNCEPTELSKEELAETATARPMARGAILILAVDPYSEGAIVLFNAYRKTTEEAIKARLMLNSEPQITRMTVSEPKMHLIKNNTMEVEDDTDD